MTLCRASILADTVLFHERTRLDETIAYSITRQPYTEIEQLTDG